jgi:hypothetical protein
MIDLETIHEMWKQDAVIDEHNLDRASIDGAKLHAKYLELFDFAKGERFKHESKMSSLRLLKWRYYSGKMTKLEMDQLGWEYDPFKGATKPMKSELNAWIDVDPDVAKLLLRIEYSKIVTSALEEILSTIKWRHQTIRNIIAWRQFVSGN